MTQEASKTKTTGSLFKPAENQTAFLKAGLLGFGGSGKTYTAALMAKGIYERLKAAKLSPKPVYFLDSETGSDFLVPPFKQWGIPLMVSKSRSFVDLVTAIKAAEAEASVLIVDSITHYWMDVQESFKKAKNRTRLLFQDWGPIKTTWREFSDLYVNSKVHLITCGRAGYEYDYFIDEAGDKQLEKTGTKMKAETEFGYEPSLLIEMAREKKDSEQDAKGKKKVVGRLWDHVAYVLKDRSTIIEGAKFVNPTFKDFEPVFGFLNIGGEHVGVEAGSDTAARFGTDPDKSFFERKKRVEVLKEEIMGEILLVYPGRSADETKAKTALIKEAFGTTSWVALDDKSPEELRAGLAKIKEKLAKSQQGVLA